MRETVLLHGVILRMQPIGEYDKRLVILTRERGRITAFARGARRPKSSMIAATNPFVFAEFSLYEGRDSYTLAAAEVKDYFEDLPRKMPEVFYAYYTLELADYYGREGVEAAAQTDLIYVTLKALLKGSQPPQLIKNIYELRTLVLNGDYAVPSEELAGSRALWFALRYTAAAPFQKLYGFSLDEDTALQFQEEAERALLNVTDRQFRSLDLISQIP